MLKDLIGQSHAEHMAFVFFVIAEIGIVIAGIGAVGWRYWSQK